MDRIVKISLLVILLLITGCDCTLGWDGICHRPCRIDEECHDSYRELYHSYEAQREKKIVPGLGGALYRSW